MVNFLKKSDDNMQTTRTSGFILVLTFFIMSATILVTTYLLNRLFAGEQQTTFFEEREQAKMLALGGLELIKSRLEILETTQDEKIRKEQLEWLLMNLNEWSELRFSQKVDGVEGTVQFFLSCEDGKINLNRFFDATKKNYLFNAPENKAFSLMMTKLISKQLALPLIEELEKALKKQKTRLDDLSELLVNPPFSDKDVEYTLFPRFGDAQKTKTVCLGDLFTLFSEEIWRVNPLYISKGLQQLFGFKSFPQNKEEREKIIKGLVEKVQQKMNWPASWDTLLAPIYGKKFAQLDQQLMTLFGAVGGARTFSVVCYGKFGEQSQGVCALLQKRLGKDKRAFYVIRRLYWI